MSFVRVISNLSFQSPMALLDSCSWDHIDVYCIMDLTLFPIMGFLMLMGFIMCFYMTVWIGFALFRDYVYVKFLAKMLGHTVNLKKMGKWAVVTGATDGIGKAYAEELARRGLDVILISRTLSKLEEVAKSIQERFKVETKVIDVDFTRLDIYDKISKQLQNLEIGVLINNVGMSYQYPEYFLDIHGGEQIIHDMVNCNIMSTFLMTRMLLPGMVERHRGVVVNLSSTAATYPVPFLNVYSSTKVCVDYFSRALQNEYRSKGIIIQSVLPFFVATNMSKIKKTSMFVLSPSDYVRAQLKTIGLEDRTFGCNPHNFQGFCTEFLVHFFPNRISNSVFHSILKDMNRRARIIQAKNNKKE